MLFREVKVARGGSLSGPPSIPGVDAVLIPEMASVARDQPLTRFETQTMAMQVKWTLNDQKGDPIWVTTIAGEGKGPMRSGWSKDTCKQQVDALLLDVFSKSAKEISGAELIRRHAGAAAKGGL